VLKKSLAVIICSLLLTGMAPYNAPLTDGKTALSPPSDPEAAMPAGKPDEIALPALKDGEVTADSLNVRIGPGVGFPVVGSLNKSAVVRILGSIRGWLAILLPDDSIGMVSAEYVKVNEPPDINEGSDPEADMAARELPDAAHLFLLVNNYRADFGLPAYVDDEKLNKAAQLKAGDMVKNNYFNHESPIYGTPFAMLRNLGVFYKTASENLARTADVTEAFTKMTGNLAHRTNLVSRRFTNMGIGVADDINEPGKKIIVLLFTEV